MYNVLLVDDEPWVLMGLQRIFNWEKYDFHVISAVSGSLEALEIIKSNPIDVIFSDIRMPNLSGLDLLKAAKEVSPSITFILVSGFADFSYAQEACRQGAYDYLLKPIDHTRTDAFLQRLQQHIFEIRHRENLYHYDLLQNGKKNILAFFSSPRYRYFQAFALTSERMLPDIVLPDCCLTCCLEISSHKKVFLCNTEKDLTPFLVSLNLTDINTGISQISTDPFINFVEQADVASGDSFFSGVGIYTYHPTDSCFITSICSKMHDCFNGNGSISDICRLFEQIPTEKLNINDAVYLWNQFRLSLPDSLCSPDFTYTFSDQLIQEFRDWSSLLATLRDLCNGPSPEAIMQDSASNTLSSQILSFIQAHYTEPLFLKDVADHFYLNCTYFSEFFKKNIGTTFSKYLTGLRLGKAADLLRHSPLTIEEICFQSGYNDYSYFNKVFKKHFSCTPYQYRKENGKPDSEKGA